MGDEVTAADLFCGAGGFSLGAEMAGVTPVYGADMSQSAVKTYNYNFDAEGVVKDLAESGPDISPDVVLGGPPCQEFSTAGCEEPGERAALSVVFAEMAADMSPGAVVMENVPEIKKYDEFGRVVDILEENGFSVGYKVLKAERFGVPQKRRRMFIQAVREGEVSWPEGSGNRVTVGEALRDLPEPGSVDAPENHIAARHSDNVRERFREMDQGRGMESVPEDLRTKKRTQNKFDPERPAPTIMTLPDDYVHPWEPRIPTVREMARLQGFPDDFVFKGRRRTGGSRRRESACQYQQVGNAVPPPLAAAVIRCATEEMMDGS